MSHTTCADRFATVAYAAPDAIAVRHDATSWTYGALAGRAGALASRLREHGVRPGDVVATVLPPSPHAVAATLAIWAVGAACAHIDVSEPDTRLAALLPATGAGVVLTDRRVPGALAPDDRETQPYQPIPGRSAHDVAYIVLTPGPTVVAIEHGSVDHHVTTLSHYLPAGPLAADPHDPTAMAALLTGNTLDVDSPHPVAALKCTPSQLDALLAADVPLPTDALIVAGEPFPTSLAHAVRAARPDLAVYHHYGPPEAIGALLHHVTEADLAADTVPLGRPLPGVEITIVDGQLHVGGPTVARGYPGPVPTGDLVRRNDNGDLEWLGRADRRIDVNGRTVEPAEIEAVFLAQRGIRQAVVTGEPRGPGRPLRLVAYLVGLVDPADLTRRLRLALPERLIPEHIHHVARIPATRGGTTNLTALRKLANSTAKPVAVVRPRTESERLIADVWCAVLGHVQIDVHTTFAELGGDSAKSLVVLDRLRRHFPTLTTERIAAYPTVAELAAATGTDDSAAVL